MFWQVSLQALAQWCPYFLPCVPTFSAGEFKQRLNDEFDFMVAPLVFDLELRVDPASLDAQEAQQAQQAGHAPATSAGGGASRGQEQQERQGEAPQAEHEDWELAGGDDSGGGATTGGGAAAPGGGGGDPQPPAAAAAGPEDREQRSAAAGVPPGGGWKVVHVYGSPDSEERRLSSGGSIMRVGAERGVGPGGQSPRLLLHFPGCGRGNKRWKIMKQ